MGGAWNSMCKGMKHTVGFGEMQVIMEHKVSWKVRLRTDKKLLRLSVPKRLSSIYK